MQEITKNSSERNNTGIGPESSTGPRFTGIIGQSDNMREVYNIVEKVAISDSTVIINGETGTGKGLIARATHENSNRRKNPFVAINCGSIPENLLESELFGHVRGAFTGALSDKPGKFERANGGTIFLDEIGDMNIDLQVKILKVLEEREFERVGGGKTIKVDVRIIAATHRDLEEEVQKGHFREDLFYRLCVIPVTLPPVRERKSDIPLLVSHFLQHFNEKNNKDVKGVSDEAMKMMVAYSWPGNVREIKNLAERLVVLKGEGEITLRDLPEKLREKTGTISIPNIEISDEGVSLNTLVTEFEKSLIIRSLEMTKGVKNRAANLLKVKRTTLVEKIKKHNLDGRS